MEKTEVEATTSLPTVEKMARVLWGGHYGYTCPNCSVSVYGRSVEWCHAHLLEHLVIKIRKDR
jgi:hypothetical protein